MLDLKQCVKMSKSADTLIGFNADIAIMHWANFECFWGPCIAYWWLRVHYKWTVDDG